MRKLITFALLLLSVVSLAAPIAAASSDLEEYPLVSYTAQMYDSSILCPVIISESNYDSLSKSKIFGDLVKSMSWGNIYLFKYDKNHILYSSLVTEGNYSCYYNHNQFVYAVNNGKDIWCYDVTTGEGFLIASSENDIDLIYGYDDLVFCSSGSSVYLCRVSEGTLKEIYNNPEMLTFYPLTNHVIQVSAPNPFYTECLAHEFTDAASYYDWFISNNGFSPFSREESIEYLSTRPVEQFLISMCDLVPSDLLFIDFIDNSVSDTFSYSPSGLDMYNDFVTEVDSFYTVIDEGKSVPKWMASHNTPPQTSDSYAVFYVLAAVSAVCGLAAIALKNPFLSDK